VSVLYIVPITPPGCFAKVAAGALSFDTTLGRRTKTKRPSPGTHNFSLIYEISGKLMHRRRSMLGQSVVEDPKPGLQSTEPIVREVFFIVSCFRNSLHKSGASFLLSVPQPGVDNLIQRSSYHKKRTAKKHDGKCWWNQCVPLPTQREPAESFLP